MDLEKLVGFDVKNLGRQSNVIVNPCHPWPNCSLFGELITEFCGKKYLSLADTKILFTSPTDILGSTYSISTRNTGVTHMDMVPALTKLAVYQKR